MNTSHDPGSLLPRLIPLGLMAVVGVLAFAYLGDNDTAVLEENDPRLDQPLPGADAVEQEAGEVSFTSSVQPILETNCVGCHGTGGPGNREMSLVTAGDAAARAKDIGLVTRALYMPPWPASDVSVPFHGDRRLSADEITTLAAWADEGGTLDNEPTAPLVAAAPGIKAIDRDAVINPPEPYAGSPDKVDDYRCLLIDPQLSEPVWLKAMAFEADQSAVVHHSVVFRATAGLRDAVAELDGADGKPGWECFGLAGLSGNGRTDQIMAWAPGQQPTEFPDGTGIRFDPGDFLVMQVHYHYGDETPLDNSAMVLDFAEPDELEAAGGTIDPIAIGIYLAPAEIPCAANETGPLCDRDAALADVGRRFGRFATAIPNGLLAQCGAVPSDFAAMTAGVANASCDHRVTGNGAGQIVHIFGHMHELGSTFRMTLNPGTTDERVLLDIPFWDFEWQLNYQPIDDIVLNLDDVIRVECSWDRAKMPRGREPAYVLWAEGTGDEMCYSTIATRPVS